MQDLTNLTGTQTNMQTFWRLPIGTIHIETCEIEIVFLPEMSNKNY